MSTINQTKADYHGLIEQLICMAGRPRRGRGTARTASAGLVLIHKQLAWQITLLRINVFHERISISDCRLKERKCSRPFKPSIAVEGIPEPGAAAPAILFQILDPRLEHFAFNH
jgi:hypothetical protein